MLRPKSLQDEKFKGWQKSVIDFVEHKNFIHFITILILMNAVTLGLETDKAIMADYGHHLKLFDQIFLSIFIIEIALKMSVYRLQFFKSGWNTFDFLIVFASLLPQGFGLSVLRVLRIFRLIVVVPQMRKVVGALFHAIPGMAAISGILFVLLYVAAVLSTYLFGQSDNLILYEHFGTLSHSMYTMFQLMTLEGWPDIATVTLDVYPWAWMFFVPYIIITTFAVLNLFIGIIVDALHLVKEEDLKALEDDVQNDVTATLKDIQSSVNALKRDIAKLKK